jgi:hypothetical protein
MKEENGTAYTVVLTDGARYSDGRDMLMVGGQDEDAALNAPGGRVDFYGSTAPIIQIQTKYKFVNYSSLLFLLSGILSSWLRLLIRDLRLAYHSHANRITSPSASYGVGISLYPGRAVGCRT